MRRYLLLLIGLVFFSNVLTSCSNTRNPTMNSDLTRETWMREVDTNPSKWTRGADNWFLTGDPNATEVADRNAPNSAAISTMNVRASDFSNIKINGNFQVQIFGTYGNNSIYVYGPNDGVRDVMIEVQGDTLCINQIQTKKPAPSIRNVIVRIGVNRLNSVTQLGGGTVEGIQLRSNFMTVTSNGSGNMYLAGRMNLQRVTNTGRGCISIFGAITPVLDIKTSGMGTVNVSGNVGVRSIMHHGRSNINIIGANTNTLKIYADGKGKIGINGIVNLCELKAHDLAQVYIYQVKSNDLYVYVYDKARVGLAGTAGNLYIDAFKASCVGARNLCANTAFVRAHGWSHVNIAAGNKIFAAATENSSVYFFGSPNVMSQFVRGNGVVIPVWSNASSCPIVSRIYSYKGEHVSSYPYTKWNGRPQLRGEG